MQTSHSRGQGPRNLLFDNRLFRDSVGICGFGSSFTSVSNDALLISSSTFTSPLCVYLGHGIYLEYEYVRFVWTWVLPYNQTIDPITDNSGPSKLSLLTSALTGEFVYFTMAKVCWMQRIQGLNIERIWSIFLEWTYR